MNPTPLNVTPAPNSQQEDLDDLEGRMAAAAAHPHKQELDSKAADQKAGKDGIFLYYRVRHGTDICEMRRSALSRCSSAPTQSDLLVALASTAVCWIKGLILGCQKVRGWQGSHIPVMPDRSLSCCRGCVHSSTHVSCCSSARAAAPDGQHCAQKPPGAAGARQQRGVAGPAGRVCRG